MKRLKDKTLVFDDFPEFRPNLTPREIFLAGSFGGGYWRPINSAVAGKKLKNRHKKFDFLKDIPDSLITNEVYDKSVNTYGVKVGTSLEYWESNNWIKKPDPYGWVEWYCNFYAGRRSSDDRRQIDRWEGIASKDKGRFRRRLMNMIKKKNAKFDDFTISPAIRQTLQHWAFRANSIDC